MRKLFSYYKVLFIAVMAMGMLATFSDNSASADHGDPVECDVTGHCYQWVPTQTSWYTAKLAAEGMVHDGVQGHLATITSDAETDFIVGAFPTATGGSVDGGGWAFFGGYRLGSNGAGWGPWQWVTGETFGSYEKFAGGEPSGHAHDGDGTRGVLGFFHDQGRNLSGTGWTAGWNGFWNDANPTTLHGDGDIGYGYIVEFDAPAPSAPVGGPIFVTGDDADDSGHCQGTRCGSLLPNLIRAAYDNSSAPGNKILIVGANSSSALSSINGWLTIAFPSGVPANDRATSAALVASANLSDYRMIYVASVSAHTGGGMNPTTLAALGARSADIATFVNNSGGGLIALTEANVAGGWGWMPVPLVTQNTSFTSATVSTAMAAISPTTTNSNLSHCCFHNVFTGPQGSPAYSGLEPLAFEASTGRPVWLGSLKATIKGSIDLAPLTGTDFVGQSHTVTATADDGGPAAGAVVTFTVTGVNGPQTLGPVTADANGVASVSYIGANEGTDTIIATFVDAAGATQISNAVEMIWEAPTNMSPVLTVSPGDVIEADGPLGSNYSWSATATDTEDDDNTLVITCDWSGTLFPIGDTTVDCSVVDSGLLTDTGSFTVTVEDTIAPEVDADDVVVEATGPNGQTVTFDEPAATDAVGVVSIVCDPASGSTFQIGDTTVNCTATDEAGNEGTTSFTVTVQDTTAPMVTCEETHNPSGKNIPKAGKNAGKSGQNPDGYYVLGGSDSGSGIASIELTDSDSSWISDNWLSGTIIKLTQALGVTPNAKKGSGTTDWKVQLNGDGVVLVTDVAGNTSTASCLVPKPPK